MKGTSRGLL